MPLLVGIIAKALAFVDAILGAFATVGAPQNFTAGGANANCGYLTVYNVELTECGKAVATQIAGIVNVGLATLNAVLGGLLAV